MTTLKLQNVNAFVTVPDHVEVVIRRLPHARTLHGSTYRRLWSLLRNGATMEECYLMIATKRPALDLMRERLEKGLGQS